jgi:mono/diheme cytochrome c family protein
MQSRFYASLLLISALILLALVSYAGLRELNPEWKTYQTEYKRLFQKNASSPDMKKKAEEYAVGVRQIYLKDLNKVDRCDICHAGLENPLMAKEKVPYKQHSGAYLKDHPITRFGCTICHLGQGNATNKKEAHAEGHETFWDFPILPLKHIQSSCTQCHDMDFLSKHGGEVVVEGKKLFDEKGCRGCHKLNGNGGSLGKALDGVGSQPIHYFPMRYVDGERTQPSWLKQHFDDPRKVVPESIMKVKMTSEEAEKLTTYILSIRTVDPPKAFRNFNYVPVVAKDGHALFNMYCVACHADGKLSAFDENLKGTIPAIENTAFLKNADNKFLEMVITEGRKGTPMTSWQKTSAGLSDVEIKNIVSYIAEQRTETGKPVSANLKAGDKEAGKEIFNIRCALCHGDKGQGGLGLNLSNQAVKKADDQYLFKTIRDGRTTTPMPPFGSDGLGLTDQQIVNVISYIKTF